MSTRRAEPALTFVAAVVTAFVAVGILAGSSQATTASATLSIRSSADSGPMSASPERSILSPSTVTLEVDAPSGAEIRWYRIVPDIDTLYHNAGWPWDPDAYRWLGFESIHYTRTEVLPWSGRSTVLAWTPSGPTWPAELSPPTHARADAGSFWFQAEVRSPAGITLSPGIDDADSRGLSPRTFRLSVRPVGGLLGWVASFHNVPAVFGSTVYQSRNYLGVDCADVLMAAWHRWKGRPLDVDWNVGRVVDRFPHAAAAELREGVPDRALRWGTDIRPGYLLAVRYTGRAFYQHIGAFYDDADGDGVLSASDRVLHAGPEPLHVSALADGGFDGHVVCLRMD